MAIDGVKIIAHGCQWLGKLEVVGLMCLFGRLSYAFTDKCPDSLRFF